MSDGLVVREENRGLMQGVDNPAIYAAAVRAAKEVEVAYMVANRQPRNLQQTRQVLLDACKRPAFAEKAEYSKPVGGSVPVKSPSIRFAEEAIRAYKNIHITKSVIYEDLNIRKIQVKVIDLENNIAFEDECTLQKTVERKSPAGRDVVSQRENSKKEITYLVVATEDELLTKTNAQVSKMIRVLSLRLIPSDIVEEGILVAKETLRKTDAVDPKAATKRIFDSFNQIGVTPEMVAEYVGSNKPIFTEDELGELRSVYSAIKDKETTWREIIEDRKGEKKEKAKPSPLSQMAENAEKAKEQKAEQLLPPKLTEFQAKIAAIPEDIRIRAMGELKIKKTTHCLSDDECGKIIDMTDMVVANL